MNRLQKAAAIAIALLTAACQGSFGSGPQIPNTLPSGGNATNQQQNGVNASASPGVITATAPTQSFAITDASKGFTCPETGGYSCTLRFNLPAETPSPSPSPKGAKSATNASPSAAPTPSPSPSASPSPSPSPVATGSPGAKGTGSPAAAASPAPSGSPIPSVALTVTVQPSDAPKMVIANSKAPPVAAVMRIMLVSNADFTLDGRVVAQFVLPKEELADRGFAVQIFEEVVRRKHHDMRALFTLAKSTLDKQTLTFSLTPPKMTLPKDHHFFIILYGDARATPSPAPSPSGTSGAMPANAPYGSTSPSPTPLPLVTRPPYR